MPRTTESQKQCPTEDNKLSEILKWIQTPDFFAFKKHETFIKEGSTDDRK